MSKLLCLVILLPDCRGKGVQVKIGARAGQVSEKGVGKCYQFLCRATSPWSVLACGIRQLTSNEQVFTWFNEIFCFVARKNYFISVLGK